MTPAEDAAAPTNTLAVLPPSRLGVTIRKCGLGCWHLTDGDKPVRSKDLARATLIWKPGQPIVTTQIDEMLSEPTRCRVWVDGVLKFDNGAEMLARRQPLP